MLSRTWQRGLETAKTAIGDVNAVASMDRPANYSHMDLGESIMYYAATLQLHGLPYDYASSDSLEPPSACPICNNALCDTLYPKPLHTRISPLDNLSWVDTVRTVNARKRMKWLN